MNIKEAKIQISNTLRAYLAKDELGNYLIPSIRQRPILLMGPPGIGKTQIMEQIASEEKVGLVAYTITHHTRQSAIGLPYIEKHTFDGTEVSVTEYTMSEILGSVYTLMDKTGIREGILFLDEINCVSETLSPMMLQFLQCKTFGNRRLPEGWLIVAAGNPPEYNRSVRDFDVVTLDRVKKMDVIEDFGVWKEYAVRKGIHGAVISYLDIRKENFFRMETGADGLQFATPRGWEDLSEYLTVSELLHLDVDSTVVQQYIQMPQIARDFANYLSLYNKYQKTYHVDEILDGRWPAPVESEFRSSPFDEKISVMGLLLSRLSEEARKTRHQEELTDMLHASLTGLRSGMNGSSPAAELEKLIAGRRRELKAAADAGHTDKAGTEVRQKEILLLESFLDALLPLDPASPEETMEILRPLFRKEAEKLDACSDLAGRHFDNAFSFLEKSVGDSQELVLFLTEITAGFDTSWFVERFGCDAYFRHNSELLFADARRRLVDDILSAKKDL